MALSWRLIRSILVPLDALIPISGDREGAQRGQLGAEVLIVDKSIGSLDDVVCGQDLSPCART